MVVEPVSPVVLVERLVELVASLEVGRRWRIAIDGAPPVRPDELADALVDPLRAVGRPVVRVRADDFLRPASLRWEFGRENPDAYFDDWLDLAALSREVLAPFGPGGSGRYLPSLRDPVTDRSTRAGRIQAADSAVLLLTGSLLLGRGLDLDRTVHLAVRPDTLRRRTPPPDRWRLPAFARYDDDVDPERAADVVVRVDDARHPAILGDRGAARR
ncbi:uridine kinase [Pengzhenrongella phosphoraccumulans]|uniref:uridine kinase n=1 Tax=Pengzhenrongella phosphoraccumulans TaxID=3114394 RepID=UPI00388DEC5F